MSSAPICDRVNTYANKSRVIPGYEGIPYNLCVNVIGWVVCRSFKFSSKANLGPNVRIYTIKKTCMGLWAYGYIST